MKHSEDLIFRLLNHVDEVNKFKKYIEIFSEPKILNFYERVISNDFDEKKVMSIYKGNTYKVYKSELKTLVVDYLSTIKLKSYKTKKLRRTLDIADLYIALEITLFEQLEKEVRLAIKKTDNDAFINLKTTFIGMSLQNIHRRKISSYEEILKVAQEYKDVVGVNYENIKLYIIQCKIASKFTVKSFIKNEQDYHEVVALEKELLDFLELDNRLTGSKVIYFLQSVICIDLLKGNYKDAHLNNVKVIKELLRIDLSNESFKQYQVGEQISNAILFALHAKYYDNIDYLIKLKKEVLTSNDEVVVKLNNCIDFILDLNSDLPDEQVLNDIETQLDKASASLYAQQTLLMLVCQNFRLNKLDKAGLLLFEILNKPPSDKVLVEVYEIASLLNCVLHFNQIKSNYNEFIQVVESTYNKFRKNKNDFALELIIVKQLLKLKYNFTKQDRQKIFREMRNKLNTKLDKYNTNYWKYYNFYFDFNKWIDDNSSL